LAAPRRERPDSSRGLFIGSEGYVLTRCEEGKLSTEKREVTLIFAGEPSMPRTVTLTPDELEQFIEWMDLNNPTPGPLTIDGVTYERDQIAAFSVTK
jgi:hypothetical protein